MKHYQLGLYQKTMPGTLSQREKLETAKKAGFSFVEISIDELDKSGDLRTWYEDYGNGLPRGEYDVYQCRA